MPTIWFSILALMLTTYVVLDGFDLGAGIVHLFVAKNETERRTVLAAIGPVWDGNEVWLVASGGVLFFAFPRAYAAATSGFYMPLMIVLWLLIGRGLAIELRSRIEHVLWRSFWDAIFAVTSTLLAFVLGATFGNLVRGVPLDADGYFHAPLFTHLFPAADAGALDLYTVTVGVFAVIALAIHGALFLSWKTSDELSSRSKFFARRALAAAALLDVALAVTSAQVNGDAAHAFSGRPLAWLFAVAGLAGAALTTRALLRGGAKDERVAFLGSCLFLAGTLLAGAGALAPVLLRSTIDPAFSIDTQRAASGDHGLTVGLFWLSPALALAVFYVVYVYRAASGKASPDAH